MDPTSILLTAVFFVGAEVARKPTNEFADLIWRHVKKALGNVLEREPVPADITGPAVERALDRVPDLRDELEAVKGRVPALRRAALVRAATEGAKVLWIDDRPENNVWERELFASLGVTCSTAETTRTAVAMLKGEEFHAIISDVARDEDPVDGLQAVGLLRAASPAVPIIFYVGGLDSADPPPGTQGITDEPGELLHLLLDQLERHRL
jgi:CheY-like chemotaxis protein